MLLDRLRQAFIRRLKTAIRVRRISAPDFKIGIFKHDGLGDFVLATGVIHRLCETYGEENCAIFVSHLVTSFAKYIFPRAKIVEIPWPRSSNLLTGLLWSIIKGRKKLSAHSFEKLICLRYQRSLYHELVLSGLLARASYGSINDTRQIAKADIGESKFRFTRAFEYPTSAPTGVCLELEAHRRILSEALDYTASIEEVIPRLDFRAASDVDFVLVSPFGGNSIRSYPPRLFAEALKHIVVRTGCKIYVCASPRDRQALLDFCETARGAGAEHIIAKFTATFAEFCSLVAGARAILTVETSTAHIATAMDKPTVVLLGGGHYGIFAPWVRSERQIWLSHALPCFGCDWRCIYPEARCITEIGPTQIVDAVVRLLDSYAR